MDTHKVVIHCAAPVEFWGPWHKFDKDIVIASKKLFLACNRNKIKKFIFISSDSVMQNDEPLIDINEEDPPAKNPNSFYGKAKKLAEQALLEVESNTKLIILRPPLIWGVGDNATPHFLEKAKKGQFVWVNNGNVLFETVHVDNVVEAIVLASLSEKDKTIYYVTDDEPISIKDYFTSLFNIYRVPIPKKNVSSFVAKFGATLMEMTWKTLTIKSPPPISRFEWAFVAVPRKYNTDKIRKELGYKSVTSREAGLKEIQQQLS